MAELLVMIPKIEIFVFGSNLRGRHGRGGALYAARYYGAIEGISVGIQGRAYAIPTRDIDRTGQFHNLSLELIDMYIRQFKTFARQNKEHLNFLITPVGCGLAGYDEDVIAPFFLPLDQDNCRFAQSWKLYDSQGHRRQKSG